MAWSAHVYLSAKGPDGHRSRHFGDHLGEVTVNVKSGDLDACLDALADAAEQAVAKWASVEGAGVAVTVELHHDDLIPAVDTLKLHTHPGSVAGEFEHKSAAPVYRPVAGVVETLEALADAAQRIYGPRAADADAP